MAVGRGSMERAAKAAGTDIAKKAADNRDQTPARSMTISEIVGETSAVEPPKAARRPADKSVGNKVTAIRQAEKKPEVKSKPVVKAEAAAEEKPATEKPAKEAVGEIVYQKSSGMLERAAKPNESFGLGDAMPVYYF